MSPVGIFLVFLGLGCRAFGGPVAHLALFRHEFVTRRGWLGEHTYSDLIALCQFLPGPTSSQVGMLLGWRQAGLGGLVAAWLGFTLPAAIIMIVAATVLTRLDLSTAAAWIHGMHIAVFAIVAGAVVSMWSVLCADRWRSGLALAAAAAVLVAPEPWMQLPIVALAGVLGWWLPTTAVEKSHQAEDKSHEAVRRTPSRGLVMICVALALAGLLLLPRLGDGWTATLADLFRTGALVIGGGHVVLPLLSTALVDSGRLPEELLMSGYGLAQVVPGPMFSVAGFIATSMHGPWLGALGVIAIFLPGALLALIVLPVWERLRRNASARRISAGLCAGVVGLLLAALYDPIAMQALQTSSDAALACAALAALTLRTPAWLLVPACAAWCGLVSG